MKKLLTTTLFIVLFLIITIGILDMPTDPTILAPSYNDTVIYYIENSLKDTGATNIVAAILADYRGFDTLGETIVLFTSIVAVASVLRVGKKKEGDKEHE
jgi:multisubunit Na+/H+ antiporter MnhB subunit